MIIFKKAYLVREISSGVTPATKVTSSHSTTENIDMRDRSGSQVSKSSELAEEEDHFDQNLPESDNDESDGEQTQTFRGKKSLSTRVGRDNHGGNSPNTHSFFEHTLQPSLGSSFSILF